MSCWQNWRRGLTPNIKMRKDALASVNPDDEEEGAALKRDASTLPFLAQDQKA